MNGRQQNKTMTHIKADNKKENKQIFQIQILHHNVQSLKNNLPKLTVLLQSDLKDVDILCFTEHWLKEDQLELTIIEHFKLVSKFSRIRS
jgi:hypothetical protein